MAIALVRTVKNFFQSLRMGLPAGRGASNLFLPVDAVVLGPAPRPAGIFSHALDFSPGAGRDLSHRLYLTLDANQWLDRTQWHFARRPVHVRRRAAMRPAGHRAGPLLSVPDVVLDQCVRWLSPFPMRSGGDIGSTVDSRNRSRSVSGFALAAVSFTGNGKPRLPRISMGQPAARSRLSRHLLRPVAMVAATFISLRLPLAAQIASAP